MWQAMRLFFVFMFLIFWAGSCKKPSQPEGPQPDISIPTLIYPIISFASVTKFIPFGEADSTGLHKGYEIHLANTNQSIISASIGKITSITPDAHGNTIRVLYKPRSIYTFVYSGIVNLNVHVNDTLNPGTILGRINPTGIINFAIILNNNTALCPEHFGAPAFNNSIQVAIDRHNSLNPGDSVDSPCKADSLPQ
ncbi:MAG: hypothetical protein JWO06_1932 [Bacteroidota bacterium]|nr:hypothetical protein [Bacteroidota bacterium]